MKKYVYLENRENRNNALKEIDELRKLHPRLLAEVKIDSVTKSKLEAFLEDPIMFVSCLYEYQRSDNAYIVADDLMNGRYKEIMNLIEKIRILTEKYVEEWLNNDKSFYLGMLDQLWWIEREGIKYISNYHQTENRVEISKEMMVKLGNKMKPMEDGRVNAVQRVKEIFEEHPLIFDEYILKEYDSEIQTLYNDPETLYLKLHQVYIKRLHHDFGSNIRLEGVEYPIHGEFDSWVNWKDIEQKAQEMVNEKKDKEDAYITILENAYMLIPGSSTRFMRELE